MSHMFHSTAAAVPALLLSAARKTLGTALTTLSIVLPAALGAQILYTAETADRVNIVIETDREVTSSGTLDAPGDTYTVVSRSACDAPYTDGARAALSQEDGDPSRVVLSGVDPLTDNGTARITMDAVLADIATPGEAELLVECVRVSNGIAEVAPTAISQPISIGDTEWQMAVETPEEPNEKPEEKPGEQPDEQPNANPDAPAAGNEPGNGVASGKNAASAEGLAHTGTELFSVFAIAGVLLAGAYFLLRRRSRTHL